MTSGIYSITHTGSGKFYIGSSVNVERRWGDHKKLLRAGKHHSVHLQRAWSKHGEASFAFEILIACALDELQDIEQIAINEFSPMFNMTDCVASPMRGKKHTAETRAKIAAKRVGQIVSAETRAKLSAARSTWVLSDVSRKKISVARTGMKFTPAHCAAMSAATKGKPGRQVSEDERKRISEKLAGHAVAQNVRDAVRAAHLGTKASEATRAKMSKARTGKVLPAAARAKISAANKLRAAERSASITHCPQGHEYTEANTYHGSHNSRACRTCAREHMREVRASKKQVVSTREALTIDQEN